MKFESKYDLDEVVDFGTEKGVIIEISFKHESEPVYTVQYLNPFSKYNVTMSESAMTTCIEGGKYLVEVMNRSIRNKIKARIEELGSCEWCRDGKGKCPAYRGEEVTHLNCTDVYCSKASVIGELKAMLSGAKVNTVKEVCDDHKQL